MILSRLLGYPPEFRRHGPRLLSAAHVSPRRRPALSGPSLARVALLRLPRGHQYSGPIRLPHAHRPTLRSPLRPPTRIGSSPRGKHRGLPGCSRTLVHVPMPYTPTAPTVLALADGWCCLRRPQPSRQPQRWCSFRGWHTPAHALPVYASTCRSPVTWQDSVPARWLAIRRLGLAPTGSARRVSERPGRASLPLATAFPGRYRGPDPHLPLLFAFVVLRHHRRELVHFNVTDHPTAAWTARQLVEAL